MASLAIDQNILNSYSKPSLDQTKRYLRQARTMCGGLSIPTSFIYRTYLKNLANNLLNIESDMTSSINKIDEAIYKYNNIEGRTYTKSNNIYSLIGSLNFNKASSTTGSTVAKKVNSNVENTSSQSVINDFMNMLKNTGSRIETGAKSLLAGAKKSLDFQADFLLTAGTVIATPFTSIWDIGKGIFESDWSFSKTKGMWGASISLVKEEDTFKRVGATITNSFIALTKGLAHLGEALLKFGDIVNTAMDTIKTGLIDIKKGISTGDWDWKVTKDLWKKTKARVSRQYVNEAYDWFYNTKIGKELDKYAYEPFKSDGIACQILDGVGYAAGIIIVTALTFGSTAPLFLAMTATSAGIGKYTSEEWNKNTVSLNYNGSDFDMQIDYKKYSEIVNLKNGESTMISQIFQLEDGTTQEIKFKIIKKEDGTYEVFDMQGNKVEINGLKESSTLKGLGIGALKGGWEGLQYYVGGKIGTGNFKCLTNVANNSLSKALLRSGIRVTLDTATGAVEVPFETIVTRISDGVSWKEAWNKSGGWQEVKNQAIIAGSMSFAGEGIDFGKIKLKSIKTGSRFSDVLETELNNGVKTKISNKETDLKVRNKNKTSNSQKIITDINIKISKTNILSDFSIDDINRMQKELKFLSEDKLKSILSSKSLSDENIKSILALKRGEKVVLSDNLSEKTLAIIERNDKGFFGYYPSKDSNSILHKLENNAKSFSRDTSAKRNRFARNLYLERTENMIQKCSERFGINVDNISDVSGKELDKIIIGKTKGKENLKSLAQYCIDTRNDDKIIARAFNTIEENEILRERNMRKYGNSIGPTTLEEFYESTKIKLKTRYGEFSDEDIYKEIILSSLRKDEVTNTLLGFETK